MIRKTWLLTFLLTVTITVAAQNPAREICGGVDVTDDPRIEARELDGLWHSQGITPLDFPSIALLLIEDQGKVVWFSEWNTTTKNCEYRKGITKQLQSVEHGPFSPCFSFKVALPVENSFNDSFVFLPTKNLLLYYVCLGALRPDGSCQQKPFLRVMTRTLDISPEEKEKVDKRLKQLGESIDSITFVNTRENGCRRPMQKYRRSRSYYGRQ